MLVEGSAIGAGASGRNLGAIQHPFDPVLAPLYYESLSRYRALADVAPVFRIDTNPAGLLLLNRDAEAAARQATRLRAAVPELAPELLDPDAVALAEPSLTPGPSAVRLATGYPIPPSAATAAWAELAEARGTDLRIGIAAMPMVSRDVVTGVTLADGTSIRADAVLVTAGPWTPGLVDPSGAWRPIHPTYGVTIQLRLGAEAPRHIVEEDAVDAINRPEAATEAAARTPDDADPPSLFSIASAGGVSTLGSTFLSVEPDPEEIEHLLLRRATAFLPAIKNAKIIGRRMCARPQSVDGRPFIGAVAGIEGLFACAGHGPWGISIGPASAAVVARAILDGTAPIADLAAGRPT
ncbi:hypothetical protein BH23CHL10_BH23CHL10_12050 [soil metagenome]